MLAKFSVNERKDLYPDDQSLAFAYADAIIEELKSVMRDVIIFNLMNPFGLKMLMRLIGELTSLITSLINFQMLNLIYTYVEETLIEKEVLASIQI